VPEVERTSGGGGERPLLTHPPCTFISLGSSPSRIRNQPPERSCYSEIKSQPSTSEEEKKEERKRRERGKEKRRRGKETEAEEETGGMMRRKGRKAERPSLVKCTLRGLCITCRPQSFDLCFAYLPEPALPTPLGSRRQPPLM